MFPDFQNPRVSVFPMRHLENRGTNHRFRNKEKKKQNDSSSAVTVTCLSNMNNLDLEMIGVGLLMINCPRPNTVAKRIGNKL
jgi:hypothetical protein